MILPHADVAKHNCTPQRIRPVAARSRMKSVRSDAMGPPILIGPRPHFDFPVHFPRSPPLSIRQ